MRAFRTVLEQKIRERRQTFEEFAAFAETFAMAPERRGFKLGTVSVRHLKRLASGVGPKGRPLGSVRPATARLLEHIFGVSIDELLTAPADEESAAVRAEVDVTSLGGAFDWLDARAGWLPESSQWEVTSRLASVDTGILHDRRVRRAQIGRSQLVRVLWDYYGDAGGGFGAYGGRCGDGEVVTSILTCRDWVDLRTPLAPDNERFELVNATEAGGDVDVRQAVDRLAEAAALDVRMADLPIYRLVEADIVRGSIRGSVATSTFSEYALSMDLLEGELVDVLAGGGRKLPLRDRFLPDLSAVLDLRERLCAVVRLPCALSRVRPTLTVVLQTLRSWCRNGPGPC